MTNSEGAFRQLPNLFIGIQLPKSLASRQRFRKEDVENGHSGLECDLSHGGIVTTYSLRIGRPITTYLKIYLHILFHPLNKYG